MNGNSAAIWVAIIALVGTALQFFLNWRRISPQNDLDRSQAALNWQKAADEAQKSADDAQNKLKELQGEFERRIEDAEKKMVFLQADLDLWKRRAHESRAHVALTLQYGRPTIVDNTQWVDGDGRVVTAAD